MKMIPKIIKSWSTTASSTELQEIMDWVEEMNRTLKVSITRTSLSKSSSWFYDETSGEICNKNHNFFQIRGLRQYQDDKLVLEQPVLIQDEIGYLGIICQEQKGVLYMLMQAKIEPGNVNKIQISPTIQATKSNFTQQHGGKKPAYLDCFLHATKENTIVDQIQSEQSSRFLGKRNRNIIIEVKDEIEVLPSHRWMTLGTIKQLMRIDNLVNMDTRTVLSCIPFSGKSYISEEKIAMQTSFSDKALFKSIFNDGEGQDFVEVYHYINDYKMMGGKRNEIVPLAALSSWKFSDNEIVHKGDYPFRVIFCDIEIEGREITHWDQPLIEAIGIATFGLLTADFNGKTKFLVQAKAEAGCFDHIELAPTVQIEAASSETEYNQMSTLFFRLMEKGAEKRIDVLLSEEGGRFYHEQNRNIILKVSADEIRELPEGYFWLDYSTLNRMVQFNNVLNIQLRNLLSLLEI